MELARVLRGLSLERAECYGKPHHGAHYTHGDAYRLDEGARCLVCGRPAQSAHHEPPKGYAGRTWEMRSEFGTFVLRPALIALCGTGTTGCHGARHNGLLRIRWVWDNANALEVWWSGYLLHVGIEPHDPRLYALGHWEVER